MGSNSNSSTGLWESEQNVTQLATPVPLDYTTAPKSIVSKTSVSSSSVFLQTEGSYSGGKQHATLETEQSQPPSLSQVDGTFSNRHAVTMNTQALQEKESGSSTESTESVSSESHSINPCPLDFSVDLKLSSSSTYQDVYPVVSWQRMVTSQAIIRQNAIVTTIQSYEEMMSSVNNGAQVDDFHVNGVEDTGAAGSTDTTSSSSEGPEWDPAWTPECAMSTSATDCAPANAEEKPMDLTISKPESSGAFQQQQQQSIPSEVPKEKQVKCELCGKVLSWRSLKRHYEMVHLQLRYTCDICSSAFKDPHYLKVHQRIQHGIGSVRTYKCRTCQREFARKDYLEKHQESRRKCSP